MYILHGKHLRSDDTRVIVEQAPVCGSMYCGTHGRAMEENGRSTMVVSHKHGTYVHSTPQNTVYTHTSHMVVTATDVVRSRIRVACPTDASCKTAALDGFPLRVTA